MPSPNPCTPTADTGALATHAPTAPPIRRRLAWHALGAIMLAGAWTAAQAQATIPKVPLSVRQGAKPMVMLVASKEHRLFYEAYNDASDIDGDGALDIRFKPSITYLGLFNPNLCYSHNGNSDNTGLFTPAARAAGSARTCTGHWSGNWLNYVTTSRIDALRVVLYGGMREVDTATETILRRAYIPQDGHSWAKEYTSTSVDGYKITDYTPIAQPARRKRHFFGNLTQTNGVDCTSLSNCSGLAPVLAVVTDSERRVWQWASSERPVLSSNQSAHGGTLTNYAVRVVACATGYTDGCKAYGSTPIHKPVGLLHEFGENDTLLFGLLTGSYDNSLSGGRLRKVVKSFREEVTPATGQFKPDAAIVNTFNALRIRDFNNGTTDDSYKGGWLTNAAPSQGTFPDWGNPIAEMMYEALRYFAGRGIASDEFASPTTIDSEIGLPAAAWDDPYAANSAANAPICARASLLVISDVNLSYDSDQVPGALADFLASGFTGSLPGFNAGNEARSITNGEPNATGQHFIGQSGTVFDSAPSPKEVTSLGSIRGLAPEEPTKQGSYYSAAAAYFGKRTDLRPDKAGRQSAETFVVALASPLPRIVVPLPGSRTITLVPFAKSVGGGGISNEKGSFQPTNQIVDIYVERIANSGPADANPNINAGRYEAVFRINYEDMEQGADHDMDAIARYTIRQNADNSITVTVQPLYEAGGIRHRIGYVISGTQADGVYLEVQDEDDQTSYFLNTPPGKAPNYCDQATVPAECNRLPYLDGPADFNSATRTFTAGTTPAATLLKDPLWYAAKWGAFKDRNGNDKPDLSLEWDEDGDGVPDAYLPVQDPLKLREALRKTLENIAARASSESSLASNGSRVSSNTHVYQALFDTQRWSGDLLAWQVTNTGLSAEPAWRASQALPAWATRKIYIATATNGVQTLSADSLSGAGQEVVNFLRGDRSRERQNGGTLRDRSSPLGDIVHSSPVHDPETDTVYVSANDGMLHALRGSDGQEIFAFIPQAAADRISQLASLAYDHPYLLDGEIARAPRGPLTRDQSYLYALLGRGGKGLFSLNVTEPRQFGPSNFLWEYSSATASGASDNDLGLMLGRPVVVPLNNGKLGVIVGNGYNSTSGKAVLYIFVINTDGSLATVRKLDTAVASGNGLAGPGILDVNRDGKADFVYAGDLQGNVWKFDISSPDPANWRTGLDGRPLFQARDASGNAQPITAPMLAVINDRANDTHINKTFVFFGTGAYFREPDPADRNTQSWYGLIDENVAINSNRSELRQRTIPATGTLSGHTSRTFSAAGTNDMAGKRGWFIDLNSPAAGERIVSASQVAQLAAPALVVTSLYPVSDDPCIAGGRGFLNMVDPFTGGALTVGVIDVTGDGDFTNDRLLGNMIGSVDLGVGLPSEPTFLRRSGNLTTAFMSGSGTATSQETGTGAQIHGLNLRNRFASGRRIVWREIVRD